MLVDLDALPKSAKKLPEDAQKTFLEAYNDDFGWRCSEAHAEKAAWRAVRARFEEVGEEGWRKKA